ncbi:MAG: choice-of-anchor V domain-containing protein [Bacteroidota bacterium]
MKIIYLPLISLVFAMAFLSMQGSGTIKIQNKCATKNSGGAPAGRTGAPGEPSCATSTCHSGATQDGSIENTLTLLSGVTPVTDYIPGETYNVVVAMTSNPTKRGFQATALTATNAMAGNFTGQTPGGTAVSTSAGRKYANHTSSSNLSSQISQWTWTWTAPATNVGPVTFYLATNKTNSSNTSSGDVIYLSQHVFGSTASLQEETTNQFEVGYNFEKHQLELSLESELTDEMILNLLDLNGKSVFHASLGKSIEGVNKTSIKLPSDIENGIYVATIFAGNHPYSQKVMIQK